ncbi:MAG: hypothetical protein HRT38_08270 [Alteromonadaceae bacterium]|nr:hypothetical protein [Alteromonadaceae bacterium]
MIQRTIQFEKEKSAKIKFERTLNAQLAQKVVEVEAKNREVEAKNKEILSALQQLVQSEKMASLGTLTAGVAHEINNPTNYASAAAYMMKNEIIEIKVFLKQLAGGDKADSKVLQSFDDKFAKLENLTQTVNEGTTRIKKIVEDLRTFSRLGNAIESQVYISELIKSTLQLVKTQYHAITIKVQFDYDPLLTCLPSKLNQVFMNLIVNACQAVEDKMEQEQEQEHEFAGQVTISSEQQGDQLVITFKDNGCGIDEFTQKKIFDPFFTTKDIGRGTGLGLAISFGIIEEHRGTLKVSSRVGEGTTFFVYLPVR